MIKYSNENDYWPTPGGEPCTTSKPIAYLDCPMAGIPGQDPWPPSTYNFYGGGRAQATYDGTTICPVGVCDKYSYSDTMRGSSATYLINAATQIPYKSTMSAISGQTVTIIIQSELNQAPPETAFAKPANCSSTPSTPPPTKSPSDCKAELQKAGCSLDDADKCQDCSKDHKDDLKKVGCPHKECKAICKAIKPAPGPPAPSPPAPSPPSPSGCKGSGEACEKDKECCKKLSCESSGGSHVCS